MYLEPCMSGVILEGRVEGRQGGVDSPRVSVIVRISGDDLALTGVSAGRLIDADRQCVVGRVVRDPEVLEVEARDMDEGLEGRRDHRLERLGVGEIRREDYDAWGLGSGKVDRDVSGEVNAQQLPMIELFHRDACAPAHRLGPAGTPRSDSSEESGEQRHRVIVLSFAGPSAGKASDEVHRSNRWRSHPGSGRSGCATQSAVRITT